MIKNITAVVFALLLCATAFAQTPAVNEEVLKETQFIAEAWASCTQAASVPEKVKTLVSLYYRQGLYPSPSDPFPYDIPAVFLPSNDKNYIEVAVSAKDLRRQKRVKKFFLTYSATLVAGKYYRKMPNSPDITWYTQHNNGCPKGMTPRYSRKSKETDICLFAVPAGDLKDKFQQLFSANPVTPAMAAEALKRK